MSTCPDGHTSESDDYCDVCGTPMDGPSSGAAATAAPADAVVPQGIECPNCQSENVANALFCEACGYDFTTGTMPRPWVSPFAAMSESATTPGSPTETPSDDTDSSDGDVQAVPAAEDAEAEDVAAEHVAAGASEVVAPDPGAVDPGAVDPGAVDPGAEAGADDVAVPDAELTDYDLAAREQAESDRTGAAVTDDAPAPAAAWNDFGTAGGYDSPPVLVTDDVEDEDDPGFQWVAELWVDPDWYRQQEPPDPMPSPGLPTIIPLTKKSNLVGRPSRSRDIHPDVDCDSDPGASRRQAQLTTDGRRWWVEDLDSANGTYVAGSFSGLPEDPLPVGQRRELNPDDRIYLGAWTRMVIRRATEEELETFA